MATRLSLAQDVARESRIIPGAGPPGSATALPVTTNGQTGKLAKIVGWVDQYWEDLQKAHHNWKWMRKEFSGKLTSVGIAKYTAATWSLTDVAEWMPENKEEGYQPLSVYKQSDGVATESPLSFIEYEVWRARYGRGQVDNGPISEYSISPSNEICFRPCDAVYVVRGEYWKTPQTLQADDDVPECPVRFHDAIKWGALRYLAENIQGELKIATSRGKELVAVGKLEFDQLPRPRIRFQTLA